MTRGVRTTPRSFYDKFVLPNLEDYLVDAHDIRRGFNASVSAFQLADVMFNFYTRNDRSKILKWGDQPDFLKDLSRREPSFQTIQSVATVYKHLYLAKRQSFHEVGSPADLWSIGVSGGAELSRDHSHPDVLVRRFDGTSVSLKNALESVVLGLWPAVLPQEEEEI
jgi:hypothetical protein